MRTALVTALVACADVPLRSRARRFLLGLSSDELQFIAEFLGACILECGGLVGNSREQLACRIAEFQQARSASARSASDEQHKMILLLEFLTRKGQKQNLEVRN